MTHDERYDSIAEQQDELIARATYLLATLDSTLHRSNMASARKRDRSDIVIERATALVAELDLVVQRLGAILTGEEGHGSDPDERN